MLLSTKAKRETSDATRAKMLTAITELRAAGLKATGPQVAAKLGRKSLAGYENTTRNEIIANLRQQQTAAPVTATRRTTYGN